MALLKIQFWAAIFLAGTASAFAGPVSVDAGTSLLVVAPHPDDETLCCAGVIRRVVEAGGRVSVVWITSGDGSVLSMFVRDIAQKRVAEARAATGILGVPADRLYFLGYPDGHVDSHSPNLQKDFAAVIERTQPNLVLAPSFMDTHADHSASGRLAYQVFSRRGELPKLRYWIVHGGEGWPSPRGYMPSIPLNIPPRGAALDKQAFTLTDDEVELKHQAIEAHHTQMRVMAPFLLAFVRTSELYSKAP